MIEKIVKRKNLTYGCRKAVAKAGSAGTDGMSVKERSQFLKLNRDRIITEIISCKYKSQPILGIEIPKSNGKTRLLGVPTAVDRVLQQAVLQVMEWRFESQFTETDDFSIYAKSKPAARKIGNAVFEFLRDRLKLKIVKKADIRVPVHFQILGYGFVPTYKKGDRGQYQLVATDKSWNKLKEKVKEATRKTSPMSFDERMKQLKEIHRGWLNYFSLASLTGKLKEIDSWIRNRIRYCIWTDWKKPDRKKKNLIRLGIPQGQAYSWSRTRKGGWGCGAKSDTCYYDHSSKTSQARL